VVTATGISTVAWLVTVKIVDHGGRYPVTPVTVIVTVGVGVVIAVLGEWITVAMVHGRRMRARGLERRRRDRVGELVREAFDISTLRPGDSGICPQCLEFVTIGPKGSKTAHLCGVRHSAWLCDDCRLAHLNGCNDCIPTDDLWP
jgi:hypothetical protein